MERKNVRSRAQQKICNYGMVIGMTDPAILEMVEAAGYDFVRLDCEHFLYDNATLREFFTTARLLGLPAQVRIPDLDRIDALLALEPAGICIPDVDCKEKAMAAADAIKFAPLGHRGSSASNPTVRYGKIKRSEYERVGNDNIDLIVQIESVKAIEHIDEILSVEGIDMVASGRSDLAISMGYPGQRDHPDVIAAENLIIEKALSYGKLLTLSVSSRERLDELHSHGVYCYSVGRDATLMFGALKKNLSKMKD